MSGVCAMCYVHVHVHISSLGRAPEFKLCLYGRLLVFFPGYTPQPFTALCIQWYNGEWSLGTRLDFCYV